MHSHDQRERFTLGRDKKVKDRKGEIVNERAYERECVCIIFKYTITLIYSTFTVYSSVLLFLRYLCLKHLLILNNVIVIVFFTSLICVCK